MMKSSKEKFAIIGANGYLGKHLSLKLEETGHIVRNFDIHTTSILNNYSRLDILNQDDLTQLSADFSKIFFFSGLSGTHKSINEYKSYIEINEIGLLNVLSYLSNNKLSTHIIFPSTRLVYKGSNHSLKETDDIELKTIYAINKFSGEKYLEIYSKLTKITFTVFRICLPYGNEVDSIYSYGTIGHFLSKARQGQNIQIFGDGSLKRTFTHVSDLCNQIIFASNHKASYNEIFNVGGENYSLGEVAEKIANKFGVKVEYIPWRESDLIIESGHTYFNDSKLNSIINYSMKVNLDDWLMDYQLLNN